MTAKKPIDEQKLAAKAEQKKARAEKRAARRAAVRAYFRHLTTLVMMQLKDKMDLSFVKSKRSLLFKIVAIVAQVALSGGAFFAFFYVPSVLGLFGFGAVPDSLVTTMFTLIFVLAIITCTAGLTNTLYLTSDNRVLLTLPVPPNMVFLSKFVLYFIFELKKNAVLLLPMYVAYGIAYGAVWYFYPWLVVCYVLVSLLPVAIGAVLSIPALFISNFLKNAKWLQAIFVVLIAGAAGWGIIYLIGLIPENIQFNGHWKSIFDSVEVSLNKFTVWVWPLQEINLMIIGGREHVFQQLFTMNALWGMLITIGTIAVCTGLTYLLARPLFFKMASSQFEFEKSSKTAQSNPVYSSKIAPFVYEFKRNLRSSRYVLRLVVSVLILPIAVFFLNKTYAAMNTRLNGQYMTIAFSLLICLLIVTSDNVRYSSVYSVDGAARPIAKTQPIIPQISLASRLIPRAAVIAVSTVIAAIMWHSVAGRAANEEFMGLSAGDMTLLAFTIMFVGWGHLLWSAEMDIMKPMHDQYATLGMTIDNPNERNSTIVAFLLSALVAFVLYFLMSTDGDQTGTLLKIFALAFVFLAARVYLYFTRIRLYYAEK